MSHLLLQGLKGEVVELYREWYVTWKLGEPQVFPSSTSSPSSTFPSSTSRPPNIGTDLSLTSRYLIILQIPSHIENLNKVLNSGLWLNDKDKCSSEGSLTTVPHHHHNTGSHAHPQTVTLFHRKLFLWEYMKSWHKNYCWSLWSKLREIKGESYSLTLFSWILTPLWIPGD